MTAAVLSPPTPTFETLADVLERLGDLPAQRVRLHPMPGTVTEADLLAILAQPNKCFLELVDGILVEKAMGSKESHYALLLGHFILTYLEQHDSGIVLGADGYVRLRPGQIRIPDVSFISWQRLPQHALPDEAIASVVPNLAVEVLSPSNTTKEMNRKLQDYFQAGVELVWYIDPETQTATVYTSPTTPQSLVYEDSLDGGTVLPGLSIPLSRLFGKKRV